MAVNTFSGLVRAPSCVHETIYVCLTPKEQAHLEETCRLFRNVIPKIYAERALLSTGPTFYANLVPYTDEETISQCSDVNKLINIRVTNVNTKLPIRVFPGVVNRVIVENCCTVGLSIKGAKIIYYREGYETLEIHSSVGDRLSLECAGKIRFLEVTSDENKVIVLSENDSEYNLEVLDLITMEMPKYTIGRDSVIKSMHITPDKRTAILANDQYNIRFFDLEKGGYRHSIQANIECHPMTEDPALFDAGIALFAIRNQLREAQVGNMLPSAILPGIFNVIRFLPPVVSTPILENLPYGEYSSIEKVIEAIDQFTQATALCEAPHKEVSEGKKD